MYSYSNHYYVAGIPNASFYAQQQALLAQGHQQTVPSQPVRRQHRPVSQLATAPSVPSQQLRLAPMPAALQQPQQQQKPLQQHQQQQASSTSETTGLQAQHSQSQSQSQSQPQQTRAPGLCSSCAMVVNSLRQTGITDQVIAESVCEQCKRNWFMACRGTGSKMAAAHASAHPAPAPSTSPLHFSYEKTPDISYVEEPPTPMILRDVFFTEKPVEDEDEVQFDSDGTDDTELLTPGRCLSPPMSPRDILVGDREMYVTAYCDLIEEKVPVSLPFRTSRSVSLARPQADSADTAASSPRTAGTSTARSAISPSSSATVTPDPATPAEPDVVLSAQAADKVFARALHDKLTNPTAYPKGIMVITSRHGEGARDVADASSPDFTHPYHADSECDSPTVPTPDLVSSSKRKRSASEENSDEEDSDRSSYVPRKMLATELPKRQHGSKTTAKLLEPMASDSDQSPSDSDNDSEYRPSLSANRRVAARKKKSVTAIKRVAARSTRGGTKRRQQEARKSREGSPAPLLAVEDSQSEAQQESHPEGQMEDEMEGVELTDPRPTRKPTIFQQLSDAGIDWCRYCGTTEGVNWRPGPWGKRTLCNKHGCDYKGYGFACKLPRLDLTGFMNESVEERDRPVLQLYCTVCHKQESFVGNVLVRCEGCPRAYHQNCHAGGIDDETVSGPDPWHCESACRDNLRRRRIVVELPRKKLPLMTTPKAQVSNASTEVPVSAGNATGTTSRPRSSRRNSSSRS